MLWKVDHAGVVGGEAAGGRVGEARERDPLAFDVGIEVLDARDAGGRPAFDRGDDGNDEDSVLVGAQGRHRDPGRGTSRRLGGEALEAAGRAIGSQIVRRGRNTYCGLSWGLTFLTNERAGWASVGGRRNDYALSGQGSAVSSENDRQIPGEARSLAFPAVARLELDDLLTQLVERAQDVLATQGRLRGLLRANRMITTDLRLPVLLRLIVEAACELIDVRYGALGVIAPDRTLEEFIHVGMTRARRRRSVIYRPVAVCSGR